MRTLLRIDASSRKEGAYSREMADYVERKWKAQYPQAKVIYRDLIDDELPHIAYTTIAGFYTPQEHMSDELVSATVLSDELIRELQQADDILIASPLYNLNVPSALKAYFDQVVRVGYTFAKDEAGEHAGLLTNKRAYIATAKGGVFKGTPYEAYDFQEPYLKAILGYIGVTDVTTFGLEGTATEEILTQNKIEVYQNIDAAFN